jgi:hypothetical protein
VQKSFFDFGLFVGFLRRGALEWRLKCIILNSHRNLQPVPAGFAPDFVVVLAGHQARLRPPSRLAGFLLGTIFNLFMGVQYKKSGG